MTDLRAYLNPCPEGNQTVEEPALDWKKWKPIDADVYDALLEMAEMLASELPKWKLGTRAINHQRYTIRGISYAAFHIAEANSLIYFRTATSSPIFPGVIRQILSLPAADFTEQNRHMHVILVVHRYKPKPANVHDPFIEYPDFGASIWSSLLDDRIEIIPQSHCYCHAIRQDWDNHSFILKPVANDCGCSYWLFIFHRKI